MGWRIVASSGKVSETFAVLIAQCEERWRARILTLPGMLWSVPGGRCTMKFVASTAAGAERQARQVIEDVCGSRGLKMTQVAVNQNPRGVQPEGVGMDAGQATRNLHGMRILYGTEQARKEAATSDVSTSGMFIATTNPLPKGQKLKLLLEMGSASIPLNGTVIWVREHPDGGRPSGMGVELITPPALYVHFAEKLTQELVAKQDLSEPATV